MKYSIGVPVYNEKLNFFKECLESIKKQDFDKNSFEVIVYDDGSTNYKELKKMTEKYGYIYIKGKENKGIGFARQAVVENSKGEYITFCSSDDVLLPNKLKEHEKIIKDFPDVIHYSDYTNINENGNVTSEFKAPSFDNKEDFVIACFSRAENYDMFVNFSTILIPKKCLETIPINKELRGSEDLEWVLKACKLFEFKHIPLSLAGYRRHSNMTTNKRSIEEIKKTAVEIVKRAKEFWGEG